MCFWWLFSLSILLHYILCENYMKFFSFLPKIAENEEKCVTTTTKPSHLSDEDENPWKKFWDLIKFEAKKKTRKSHNKAHTHTHSSASKNCVSSLYRRRRWARLNEKPLGKNFLSFKREKNKFATHKATWKRFSANEYWRVDKTTFFSLSLVHASLGLFCVSPLKRSFSTNKTQFSEKTYRNFCMCGMK